MCIYVPDLSNEEGNRLKGILMRSNDALKVKRAQVILASGQTNERSEIHDNLGFSLTTYVRLFMISIMLALLFSNLIKAIEARSLSSARSRGKR